MQLDGVDDEERESDEDDDDAAYGNDAEARPGSSRAESLGAESRAPDRTEV